MTEGHVGFGPALSMWLVMTGVMMAPIVLPWLKAVGSLSGGIAGGGISTGSFATGYALAWATFSAAAAMSQLLLAQFGAAPPLYLSAPKLAGVALMAVGGFQFTSLKDACLSHCRSPFGYLLSNWRPGRTGAFRMGWTHGLFCLGCCWALMGLALVVGAMSLGWMAILMGVMLLETLSPVGEKLVRPIGAALILMGAGMLAA